MSDLRAGFESAEQAVYETLGLAMPGAAAWFAVLCVASPERLPDALRLVEAHRWLALGTAYLSGYPVQSVSRPVVNLTRAALGLPASSVTFAVGLFSKPVAAKVRQFLAAGWRWLKRGYGPKRDPAGAECVPLSTLAHTHWNRRLSLESDEKIATFDVLNLSFSTLGAEQRRLHRLRAITALCRAMAAIMAVALWLLAAALVWQWPVTLADIGAAAGLAVLFGAFVERADMYDALWTSIILPQFLADASTSVASTSIAPTRIASTSIASPTGGAPVVTAQQHDLKREDEQKTVRDESARLTVDKARSNAVTASAQGAALETMTRGATA